MNSPYINTSLTNREQVSQLAWLIQMITNKCVAIQVQSTINGPENINSIMYTVWDTAAAETDIFRIIMFPLRVRQGQMADYNQVIDDLPNVTQPRLMNSALALPRTVYKLVNVNGCWCVFHSKTDDIDKQQEYVYRTVLATLILTVDKTEHASLIERATKAIVKKTNLEFTDDELQTIKQFKERARRERVLADMEKNLKDTLITLPNYQPLIDSKEDALRHLLHKFNLLTSEIKELQMKQFAVVNGDTTNNINEFFEYLRDLGNKFVLHTKSDGRHVTWLTLWNYLVIPSTAKDYFKNDPVNNDRHKLYRRPKTYYILRAVTEGRLRIAIMATYLFDVMNRGSFIVGSQEGECHVESRRYIINKHINRYNCFEQHKQMAKKFYDKGDYIGMFNQLLECTSSVNIFDNVVMDKMIPTITDLRPNTPIQIRTDEGWKPTTLEVFIEQEVQRETAQNESQGPNEASDGDNQGPSQGQEEHNNLGGEPTQA